VELEDAIRTRRTHKVGVPDGERVPGLLHLGSPRHEKEPPERLPPGDYVTFLP
jgi:hypothetical protein